MDTARMPRVLDAQCPPPEQDPYAYLVDTPEFKEALALAKEFELMYLSITGIHKLSKLVAYVKRQSELNASKT
jgi:hypothetical protein